MAKRKEESLMNGRMSPFQYVTVGIKDAIRSDGAGVQFVNYGRLLSFCYEISFIAISTNLWMPTRNRSRVMGREDVSSDGKTLKVIAGS